MNYENYRYLFPFEKIRQGSSIIIYGAGFVGMEYLKQIMLTSYCNVVAMVDKNYENMKEKPVSVVSPMDIYKLDFDYVVVALRSAAYLSEVKRILSSLHFPNERIVWISERDIQNIKEFNVFTEKKQVELKVKPAYKFTGKSVAFYCTGGLGDNIIQKKFVNEVIKYISDCHIDIYCSVNEKFFKFLYSDYGNLNIICENNLNFSEECGNYDLAVEVSGIRFIKISNFNKKAFADNEIFVKKIEDIIKKIKDEPVNIHTPIYLVVRRNMYKNKNVYTSFSYDGIFDIRDKNVFINLNYNDAKERFDRLGIKNYITVNCGNGTCKDLSKVSKSWYLDYYSQFATLFKKKYSNINIVQLGDIDSEKISGVDKYIFGYDFEVVAQILHNSIFHLDVEGGLVHMASQIGTKCVVLFGPTEKDYLGYENNINISVGECHGCFGLYEWQYRCARDLKVPKCMRSITPEIVMDKVDEYMATIRL